MAREKPPYRGRALGGLQPRPLTDGLRNKLRNFYPDKEAEEDPVWGHPADQFVAEILAEVGWAVSMLFHIQSDSKKGEVRVECADLLKSLKSLKRDRSKFKSAEHKLKNISLDLDRLLPVESDPVGCADRLENDPELVEEMIAHIEATIPLIERLPKSPRPDQKQHWVAVEMAVRVLRVLKHYDLDPAEYASADYEGCESDVVKILCAIGVDIGLRFAPTTWRDIIGEAKLNAPDLVNN